MYEIEKNIPMPKNKEGRPRKYPFADMQVGDSFFVPGTRLRKLNSSAHTAGRKLSRKFSTRKVDGGVRVWRVE